MNVEVSLARAIGLVLAIHAVAVGAAAQSLSDNTADVLVRHALTANRELAAARLDITRARARLRQTSLLPNPVLEVEQTGGVLGISEGEVERRAEISMPIEYGGKRGRRIDVADAELRAAEAFVSDRERRLAAEVRRLYAEAIAASRELSFTTELTQIDTEIGTILDIRVTEGDAPPLEASLLRVEIDRLRSRRALLEGRRRAAVVQLASVAGLPVTESIALGQSYGEGAVMPSTEEAVRLALLRRPDLRAADLNIEAAQAGLRLANAHALPEINVFGGYTKGRSGFDQTPVGPLTDQDQLFNAGVGISLPIFNRNQGAKAEAAASIEQAKRLRELTESQIRAEVESAAARYAAAEAAIEVFRQGVIERSEQNVRTMRAAYEAGAFTISEFLAERRRLVDAQRELTEALNERAIALIDLQAAVAEPVERNEESKQ
ncbi:MAG TPA: TolC family protein [Thermoanaerobaculia bacterium]|jgi:cobalt-zinc-cadmium efflux system outer membrane protein|nr:TolC family protein [Thermoanaerobaculia bacterium]